MIRIPIFLSVIFTLSAFSPTAPRIIVNGPSTTALRSIALPPPSSSSATAEITDEILSNPMFIPSPTGGAQESSDGKLLPDELIYVAKRFLVGSNGLGGDTDMLSDDFRFEGPVVGPLSKGEFVASIGRVDFRGAFPGWTPQFYGFHVDPLKPGAGGRVWYTARGRGVNSGPLPPFAPAVTGAEVINPPQEDARPPTIRKYDTRFFLEK
jgi:hypothetical protein